MPMKSSIMPTKQVIKTVSSKEAAWNWVKSKVAEIANQVMD